MRVDRPYRKEKASDASFRWKGLPRRGRRRVLLTTLIVFLVFWLLPESGIEVVRPLLFFLISPKAADSYGSHRGGRGRGSSSLSGDDILRYVDPLIGTTNGGHVFPGATLPYGMAKPVADTESPAENAAGFVSDECPIIGFSHMHDSGTGGLPSLGNFPLFVHPGCPDDNVTQCKFIRAHRSTMRVPGSAVASPGYFTVNLTNSVQAEMTASHKTALYRFSFPGTATVRVAADKTGEEKPVDVPYSPLVLVDLLDLASSRTIAGIQVYEDTGRIIGEGQFGPSFGMGSYSAFFCADFAGARIRSAGTFLGNEATEEPKFLDSMQPDHRIPSGSVGTWIHFDRPEKDEILARVGVSFMSTDQACENAEAEIPDFENGFERVLEDARGKWAEKLSVIQVDPTGVSEDLLTTFWSGLYRTLLSPQNYTGENPYWNSTEPYFDSFYCIWDSFRAQHPLLTIVDPVAQTQMVRALLDIYRHDGKLPDCRMTFCKGYTQGGSNADVVIADAYVKNLRSGINWTTAYEAVVSDAEVEPSNWGLEGRGNLVSWHKWGFIPWDDMDYNGTGPQSRTVSRGVEYAYDDYCIAQLARGLWQEGELAVTTNTKATVKADTDTAAAALPDFKADIAKYHARSANWRNYWNPDQRDLHLDRDGDVQYTSFQGFMQPRLLNGSFRYQHTRSCSPVHDMHSCYYDTSLATYEGSPWLYSFFVPQDMASLISTMGGKDAFVDRLNYFHTSGIAYMGNEQAFLPVFQFHYAGRPGLSSFWAHRYVPALFNASVNGIPGNDDCAMGAFSAFVLMGFFPVAGQDVYLLTPPFFREVRIRAGGTAGHEAAAVARGWSRPKEKWAVIRVKNFDPTYERMYIKRATLNGRPYTRNWITHEFFLKGGVLEYELGTTEGTWGTRDEDVPPSDPYVGTGWKAE